MFKNLLFANPAWLSMVHQPFVSELSTWSQIRIKMGSTMDRLHRWIVLPRRFAANAARGWWHHHMTSCWGLKRVADTANDSNPPTQRYEHRERADGLSTTNTAVYIYLQLEHSWALAQHHLDEVPVVDSIAIAAGHLYNHFFQLQVGLGHPEFLHHPFETHQIWRKMVPGETTCIVYDFTCNRLCESFWQVIMITFVEE